MSKTRFLPFVFLGRVVRWKALGEGDQEGQVMHEVHCLPGRLVAWGPTRDEAIGRMMETLGVAFRRAGGGRPWHKGAMSRLSPEDRETAERAWGRSFEEAGGLEQNVDGDNVRVVEECLT